MIGPHCVIDRIDRMSTILEISKPSSKFTFIQEKIQRVSELCFMNICIIHFERWILIYSQALLYLQITKGLFPLPYRLPRSDYQREGMGFQVSTLRLCYRLVPGEAALGTSARGKLPLCTVLARGREASRLAWCSGIPILYSRLVGFLRDECWASIILLWLIAATLKAKTRLKKMAIQSVWPVE